MKKNKIIFTFLLLMFFGTTSISVFSARIKDIANLQGSGDIQVIGYGLVTGLNNTGDNQQASFTVQSVSNMLKRFGLTVPQSNPRVRNVAAVIVTANISKFLKAGSKVDVQVSSIGDATTLQGGVLIMSPLSTSTGDIIGYAQGGVSVGGYDYQSLGSRVTRNFVTAGRVPNGLILEKDIEGQYIQGQIINIALKEPDFTTALNVANAINAIGGLANTAIPMNSANIQVQFPAGQNQLQIMQYISQIETAQVTKNIPARVVINERTGTIVVGGDVQIMPTVISHGGIEIQIQKNIIMPEQHTQPPAYPYYYPITGTNIGGDYNSVRVYYPEKDSVANITAKEEINTAKAFNLPQPPQVATVADISNALNALQVKPRDLISIFQALKEAGVLQAELIIQ